MLLLASQLVFMVNSWWVFQTNFDTFSVVFQIILQLIIDSIFKVKWFKKSSDRNLRRFCF